VKSNNSFDQFVERLVNEFSNIDKFHKLQESEEGRMLLSFVVRRMSEIYEFKNTYKQYIIPAIHRSISHAQKNLRTSKFKKHLNIETIPLKINYYDIIGYGYVSLFHKIESFVKDLLMCTNSMSVLLNRGVKLEVYARDIHNNTLRDWREDNIVEKINWISNCVKHYDGYPIKSPKYSGLAHLPENEKIQIESKEFYDDINYIAETYYIFKMNQMKHFFVLLMTDKTY